jgi:histone H3/H4
MKTPSIPVPDLDRPATCADYQDAMRVLRMEGKFEVCLNEVAQDVPEQFYSIEALELIDRARDSFASDLMERAETIAREQGSARITPVMVARAARELGRPINNHQLKPE